MTPHSAPQGESEAHESASVCIPNIGPKERAKRLRIGVIVLLTGAFVSAALLLAGADRPWRLVAFIPFWAGATALFQVYEKTCIALAARNVRNLDDGEVAVGDSDERRQIGRQARRVRLEGLATALVLTLALFALP
ncbi:MAG TPA: hypothetical protein VFZ53_11545 [Polyangiaceae bacterium]